jgi:hypothetical protein
MSRFTRLSLLAAVVVFGSLSLTGNAEAISPAAIKALKYKKALVGSSYYGGYGRRSRGYGYYSPVYRSPQSFGYRAPAYSSIGRYGAYRGGYGYGYGRGSSFSIGFGR